MRTKKGVIFIYSSVMCKKIFSSIILKIYLSAKNNDVDGQDVITSLKCYKNICWSVYKAQLIWTPFFWNVN